MMNLGALDVAMVVVYFAVVFAVGLLTMRRIKNPKDFAVAGNRIVWPVLLATLAASFIGGGATMGRAGETYELGYAFVVATIAFPIQTALVGIFIAPRLNRYRGCETIGDIFELHSGKSARLLVGILSLVVCTGILGAQALAIGTIFGAVLGLDQNLGIFIGTLFVLLYSTAGGMWATVQTDVIQFIMLGVFLPVTLILGIQKAGGVEAMIASAPDGHFEVFGLYSVTAFLTLLLTFAIGEALVPPYTQRALSANSPAAARKGYAFAGVYGLIFYFVTAGLGIVGIALFPGITGDQVLPTLVVEVLPIGITGMVAAALLAVIMSSADSMLNSTAVVFSKDIVKGCFKPDLSQRAQLWLQRGTTFTVGFAAMIFAMTVETIIDALLISYTFWAPTVVAPLIWIVLSRRPAPAALVSAMSVGALTTVVWIWVLNEPGGVESLLIALPANIVTFWVVRRFVDDRRTKNKELLV